MPDGDPGRGGCRSCGAAPVSEQQEGGAVDDEGDNPGEDDGVDGGDDGPFPAAALVLDGYEGGDAGEIEQDEDHEGEGRSGGGGPGEGVLQHGVAGDGFGFRPGCHRSSRVGGLG